MAGTWPEIEKWRAPLDPNRITRSVPSSESTHGSSAQLESSILASEEDAPDEKYWKIFPGASNAAGNDPRNSIFEESDWIDASDPQDDWRVTISNELVVEPDETGKFSFGLHGALAPNASATEYFNLRAESLRWFQLTKKPDPNQPEIEIDSVKIRITGAPPP